MSASTGVSSEINYKFIVHFLLAEGQTATHIHERLVAVYGTSAPAIRTVHKWAAAIQDGSFHIQRQPGAGRPNESVTPETIHIVESLVSKDPHITYEQIEEHVGIAAPQIHQILHDHLGLSKVCARWVPKLLTVFMKQHRLEMSRDLLLQVRATPNFFPASSPLMSRGSTTMPLKPSNNLFSGIDLENLPL
jgi:hypothetical protein